MRNVQRLGQEIEQETALQALHDENERLGLYKDAYAEQEPVAWADHGVVNWIADKQFKHASLLYTTPPQRTEQEPTPEIKYKMIVIDDLHPQGIPVEQWVNPPQRTEQNFCSRCGKRTKDLTHIHTCTPPPREGT
jgi:hypothetical protein